MRITEKNGNFYKLKNGNEIYGEEDGIRLVQIVGQHEDLEEKLKINFTIGGKAVLNGIYTKSYGFISGDHIYLGKFRIYIPTYSVHLPFEGPVGYGKTWALTKEELEQ